MTKTITDEDVALIAGYVAPDGCNCFDGYLCERCRILAIINKPSDEPSDERTIIVQDLLFAIGRMRNLCQKTAFAEIDPLLEKITAAFGFKPWSAEREPTNRRRRLSGLKQKR